MANYHGNASITHTEADLVTHDVAKHRGKPSRYFHCAETDLSRCNAYLLCYIYCGHLLIEHHWPTRADFKFLWLSSLLASGPRSRSSVLQPTEALSTSIAHTDLWTLIPAGLALTLVFIIPKETMAMGFGEIESAAWADTARFLQLILLYFNILL